MNKLLPNAALRRAIAEFPTLAEFSAAIGARYQNVQAWFKNRVPAEYCPLIERAVHGRVLCEELRPDIAWSYLRNTKRRLKAHGVPSASDKDNSPGNELVATPPVCTAAEPALSPAQKVRAFKRAD